MSNLEALVAAEANRTDELRGYPRRLRKILQKGTQILKEKPNFLEEYAHPSNRWLENADPIRSHGIYIVTPQGVFLDLTNHWNTGMLDRFKHDELDNSQYLRTLGILSQEKATPTETGAGIEAAFVDMMQQFFGENAQVYPVSAGTLAVDDAMHTARGLYAEKNRLRPHALRGGAFDQAFHGRHGLAADATFNEAKVGHKNRGYVYHVFAPVIDFNHDGTVNEEKTQDNFKLSMEVAEEYLSRADTAYMITEYPIQAEGGARVLHKDTLKKLSEICHTYGKVLIVDAVQMGGRTWYEDKKTGIINPFAKEIVDFADIVTFGKVFHANGSILNTDNISRAGFNPEYIKEHPLQLGGTHTSSLADMLSGMMIMSVITEKRLWENGLIKTKTMLSDLKELHEKYPGVLIHPRGRVEDTAYLAWSFTEKQMRDEFIALMAENEHMILLPAGETSVRLAPNPDMTKQEMMVIMSAIENQLRNIDK